jgi:predicted amidophosphoribosyltransferase
MFDIADENEEPDPLNERFGGPDSGRPGEAGSDAEASFCPYCGAKLKHDYLFCKPCGKQI